MENYFLDVAIVKGIPSGLPKFTIPIIDIALVRELFPIAVTLVMVGYLEIISIGKTLEAKQDEYRIRPNQELIALGLSNIVGSLFKAYPSTSSFSRSAINQESWSENRNGSINICNNGNIDIIIFNTIILSFTKNSISSYNYCSSFQFN